MDGASRGRPPHDGGRIWACARRHRDRLKPVLLMRTTVTEQPATTPSGGDWETSRRDKLRRIAEMGRDPWGSRFDDHASIAAIRARTNEIVFQLQDGRKIELPDPAA